LTYLVTYIEKDVLRTISNDINLVDFQQMKNILFSLKKQIAPHIFKVHIRLYCEV